jgi:hypothetical protein
LLYQQSVISAMLSLKRQDIYNNYCQMDVQFYSNVDEKLVKEIEDSLENIAN